MTRERDLLISFNSSFIFEKKPLDDHFFNFSFGWGCFRRILAEFEAQLHILVQPMKEELPDTPPANNAQNFGVIDLTIDDVFMAEEID